MNDKIILWQDADLTTFAVAVHLQKMYRCDISAILDITDRAKKFFQQQNLIKFEKTWYYHDYVLPQSVVDLEYITNFEKIYNINLWTLALNERLFYNFNRYYKFSRNEILSILEKECKLFESILEDIKPDFLIMKTTDLHHNQLFYEMCKTKGVKIMMLEQSRFGYKCLITQERDKIDYIDHLMDMLPSKKTFEELQNFLKENNLSAQLDTYKTKYLTSKVEKIKAALNFIFISKNTNIKSHYTYFGRTKIKILINSLYDIIVEKYRETFINKNLEKNPTAKDSFVYFPLHQEPERVLLIASPYYTNQIETVRHIAKSLPSGHRLLVKEHPTQTIRGWRPISFYKDIMEIPNVDLLHPSVSSEEIMKNCSLVITVGGTSGLEAAFYGKPSIIFANMGYAILSSVGRITSVMDLPQTIRTFLKKTVDPIELGKYVEIVEKNSFEFDYTGFQIDYTNYFYYGGHLADVEISEEKMKLFLDDHKETLMRLTGEYVTKIKQHKEYQLKSKEKNS